jgi:hypothetical protein
MLLALLVSVLAALTTLVLPALVLAALTTLMLAALMLAALLLTALRLALSPLVLLLLILICRHGWFLSLSRTRITWRAPSLDSRKGWDRTRDSLVPLEQWRAWKARADVENRLGRGPLPGSVRIATAHLS